MKGQIINNNHVMQWNRFRLMKTYRYRHHIPLFIEIGIVFASQWTRYHFLTSPILASFGKSIVSLIFLNGRVITGPQSTINEADD